MLEKDEHAFHTAIKVIQFAGEALDLFPQNERHQREPKAQAARAQPLRLCHQWQALPIHKAMGWRCTTCWRWAASQSSEGNQCDGPPRQFTALAAAAKQAGHVLLYLRPITDAMPGITMCAACGAMATQRSNCKSGPLLPCKGDHQNKNTRSMLRRAWIGQHPKRDRYGDQVLFHAAYSTGLA